MKISNTKFVLALIGILLFQFNASGQYATKKVKSKYHVYTDSLKNVKYDYIFPIWGQNAYKKGFDIPYPVGIMANYMWLKQGIVIENFELGVQSDSNDIPLTPVDFIQFGDNLNTSYTVNVRPDIWVFPFLNVYGIFGYGNSTTEVNLTYPVDLKSVVEQNITTYGFGVMTAFGIGPVWMSVDANWTWNKPELLDDPVKVNVLGLRLGHTFVFKHKPDRNFALWIGGMRAKMGSYSQGAIKMADAIPQESWDRMDEIVDNYWAWYNGLDPDNPFDARKIEKADEVLTPIVDRLDAADGETTILYGMDKQVKEMWNGVIGGQFQLNKHWMLRAEGGVIGDRKSVLVSANYRFLL